MRARAQRDSWRRERPRPSHQRGGDRSDRFAVLGAPGVRPFVCARPRGSPRNQHVQSARLLGHVRAPSCMIEDGTITCVECGWTLDGRDESAGCCPSRGRSLLRSCRWHGRAPRGCDAHMHDELGCSTSICELDFGWSCLYTLYVDLDRWTMLYLIKNLSLLFFLSQFSIK